MTRRGLFALTFTPFLRWQETPPQGELTELRNRLFHIEERLGRLENPDEPLYTPDSTKYASYREIT